MSQQQPKKKVILKMQLHGERSMLKAMKVVIGLEAVESFCMDKIGQKLTVIGDIDPVDIVNKLRKVCTAELLSVGPAEEVPEKEEPKKDKKKEKEPKKEDLVGPFKGHRNGYYHTTSAEAEENPNACVIC